MANNKKEIKSFKINDELFGNYNVRVTGDGIESKVMPLKDAKNLAYRMKLDLIEINPTINPPIFKIAAYDKFIYELKKNSKKPKQQELKEIQLSVNIAINDLKTKANKARTFIEDGHKVKVVLTMKGRELTRREENKRSILEFIDMLSDISTPEHLPKDEGNKTIVILKKK
jgi:translation initiation factor IF-3